MNIKRSSINVIKQICAMKKMRQNKIDFNNYLVLLYIYLTSIYILKIVNKINEFFLAEISRKNFNYI